MGKKRRRRGREGDGRRGEGGRVIQCDLPHNFAHASYEMSHCRQCVCAPKYNYPELSMTFF